LFIPDPDPDYPSRIPDPGSGSATLPSYSGAGEGEVVFYLTARGTLQPQKVDKVKLRGGVKIVRRGEV
jgi:hypothetical protein